jgi:hypothetical protein
MIHKYNNLKENIK